MHRYLTENELKGTEEGEFLELVYDKIIEAIEDGILENCKLAEPLITDDREILEPLKEKLNVKEQTDFMYYIPIIGTEEKFFTEAECLKEFMIALTEVFEGTVFKDNKEIIHINGVSMKSDEEPKCIHNVVFLMRNIIPEEELETNLIS